MRRCKTCGTEMDEDDREVVDWSCGIFVYTCCKCGRKH